MTKTKNRIPWWALICLLIYLALLFGLVLPRGLIVHDSKLVPIFAVSDPNAHVEIMGTPKRVLVFLLDPKEDGQPRSRHDRNGFSFEPIVGTSSTAKGHAYSVTNDRVIIEGIDVLLSNETLEEGTGHWDEFGAWYKEKTPGTRIYGKRYDRPFRFYTCYYTVQENRITESHAEEDYRFIHAFTLAVLTGILYSIGYVVVELYGWIRKTYFL